MKITNIINLISLHSLPLKVAQVLADGRKDMLVENKHVELS
jgi:hypothetical protein